MDLQHGNGRNAIFDSLAAQASTKGGKWNKNATAMVTHEKIAKK